MESSVDTRISATSSSDGTLPPAAIECRGVEKRYYYYTHRSRTLRDWFIRTVARNQEGGAGPEFVLNDFNLTVRRGEVVALLGSNGSGKSTALRLVGGIYSPTRGEIHVHGRLAAVMELGAGFHEDLTGAENVVLYGAVMGMTPEQIEDRREAIVSFADIGAFIDTPVRYYSTGMQARLAFAVAMSVRPDIVLLDEVLAVGDEGFRDRCVQVLTDFVDNQNGTILLVSHDLQAVSDLCQRAVWLEKGRTVREGPAAEVVAEYREFMTRKESGS